uniref:DUF808 domain-containing protein n=1 Tax=Cupriavidus ulmosensis TaxID=3065913 RepID=UPI00296AB5EF|nr:DUF808 family protein [Cupriavidus sp. CV2]
MRPSACNGALSPAALAISAAVPSAIVPLLMAGGAFLCYEGFEKIAHSFLHSDSAEGKPDSGTPQAANPETDMAAYEKAKIRGAVRTDFILSAEIIVISLGTVSGATFGTQVAVLTTISLLMTVGVYGLVAGIVKLDDAGLYLSQKASAGARAIGRGILRLAPWLMRALSVIGTAAMFLVGGGILVHGIPAAHHLAEPATEMLAGVPVLGAGLGTLGPVLINALTGIAAGALVTAVVAVAKLGMRALRPSTN